MTPTDYLNECLELVAKHTDTSLVVVDQRFPPVVKALQRAVEWLEDMVHSGEINECDEFTAERAGNVLADIQKILEVE